MPRGRPRTFDKQQAVAAALAVFWEKGFDHASCDDLLAAMGINAGSMYAAFGDKQSLYVAALEAYAEMLGERFSATLNGEGSPLQRVAKLLHSVGDHMAKDDSPGCLLMQTLVEAGPAENARGQFARRMAERLHQQIEAVLREAQADGSLGSVQDPTDLAALCVGVIQGMHVMARAKVDPHVIQGVVRSAVRAVGGDDDPLR